MIETPNGQAKLSVKDTTEVKCEECGNVTFKEVVFLREISPFISGQPKAAFVPVPTMACSSCNHVNAAFYPPELRPVIAP